MLKKNLIMTVLVATTVVAGVSIMVFPMFDQAHETIRQSQVSNKKENYKKNTKTVTEDKNKEKDKEYESLDSSSDKENLSSNPKNDNTDNNKQTRIVSEAGKTNNEVNTNQTSSDHSLVENANNNTKKEEETGTISTKEEKVPMIHYDRTTSIYANDNITLLRVEYYVNNKLTYYSSVEQFNATTKSYVEKIYQYNYETNTQSLIRTDIYSNGSLIKSY